MWAPSRSQIYKVLPRLVAWGLAESREVEQHDRPDKALYRITEAGLEELRSWIGTEEPDPPGGAAVFLMKLFFAWVAEPAAARTQLALYRRSVESHLADVRGDGAGAARSRRAGALADRAAPRDPAGAGDARVGGRGGGAARLSGCGRSARSGRGRTGSSRLAPSRARLVRGSSASCRSSRSRRRGAARRRRTGRRRAAGEVEHGSVEARRRAERVGEVGGSGDADDAVHRRADARAGGDHRRAAERRADDEDLPCPETPDEPDGGGDVGALSLPVAVGRASATGRSCGSRRRTRRARAARAAGRTAPSRRGCRETRGRARRRCASWPKRWPTSRVPSAARKRSSPGARRASVPGRRGGPDAGQADGRDARRDDERSY